MPTAVPEEETEDRKAMNINFFLHPATPRTSLDKKISTMLGPSSLPWPYLNTGPKEADGEPLAPISIVV